MVQTALFVLSNVEVAVILAVPVAVPAGTVARPEAVTVTAWSTTSLYPPKETSMFERGEASLGEYG